MVSAEKIAQTVSVVQPDAGRSHARLRMPLGCLAFSYRFNSYRLAGCRPAGNRALSRCHLAVGEESERPKSVVEGYDHRAEAREFAAVELRARTGEEGAATMRRRARMSGSPSACRRPGSTSPRRGADRRAKVGGLDRQSQDDAGLAGAGAFVRRRCERHADGQPIAGGKLRHVARHASVQVEHRAHTALSEASGAGDHRRHRAAVHHHCAERDGIAFGARCRASIRLRNAFGFSANSRAAPRAAA